MRKSESSLTTWKQTKIGNLGAFHKGSGITKNELVDAGKNAIRYGEIYTDHHFKVKSIKSFIPDEVANNSTRVQKGDILFAGSGETIDEIGKSATYLLDEEAYAGGDIILFRPNNVNSLYLTYFLNIGEARKRLRELGQGQSVVHIYKKDIQSLTFNLPSLPEQERIVAVLETWDEAIEKLKKKIEIKKQIKKGLFQSVYSQDVQFKANNGGLFPDWKIVKLKTVFQKSTKKNTDESCNFVLTNSAAEGIIAQTDYFEKKIANDSNLDSYYIVEKDNFVYNPRISSSAPVGPLKRNTLSKGVMSPLYTVLKQVKGNTLFFEYYFETNLWHRYMKKVANYGARHDRMNITNKDFLNMPIPYPAIEEQEKIANFVSITLNEINGLENKLRLLRKQKQFLLDNLVTGVIRTPEDLLQKVK